MYGKKYERKQNARLNRVTREKLRLKTLLNRYRSIQIKKQSWKEFRELVKNTSKIKQPSLKRRRHSFVDKKETQDINLSENSTTPQDEKKARGTSQDSNTETLTIRSSKRHVTIPPSSKNKSQRVKEPKSKGSGKILKEHTKRKIKSLSKATKQIIKSVVSPKHIPLMPKHIVTKTEIGPSEAQERASVENKKVNNNNIYNNVGSNNSEPPENTRTSIKVDAIIRIKSRPFQRKQQTPKGIHGNQKSSREYVIKERTTMDSNALIVSHKTTHKASPITTPLPFIEKLNHKNNNMMPKTTDDSEISATMLNKFRTVSKSKATILRESTKGIDNKKYKDIKPTAKGYTLMLSSKEPVSKQLRVAEANLPPLSETKNIQSTKTLSSSSPSTVTKRSSSGYKSDSVLSYTSPFPDPVDREEILTAVPENDVGFDTSHKFNVISKTNLTLLPSEPLRDRNVSKTYETTVTEESVKFTTHLSNEVIEATVDKIGDTTLATDKAEEPIFRVDNTITDDIIVTTSIDDNILASEESHVDLTETNLALDFTTQENYFKKLSDIHGNHKLTTATSNTHMETTESTDEGKVTSEKNEDLPLTTGASDNVVITTDESETDVFSEPNDAMTTSPNDNTIMNTRQNDNTVMNTRQNDNTVMNTRQNDNTVMNTRQNDNTIMTTGPINKKGLDNDIVITTGVNDDVTMTPGPNDYVIVTTGLKDDVTMTPGPNDDVIVTTGLNDDVTMTPGPDDVILTTGLNDDVTMTPGPNDHVIGTTDLNDDVTMTPGPNDHVKMTTGSSDDFLSDHSELTTDSSDETSYKTNGLIFNSTASNRLNNDENTTMGPPSTLSPLEITHSKSNLAHNETSAFPYKNDLVTSQDDIELDNVYNSSTAGFGTSTVPNTPKPSNTAVIELLVIVDYRIYYDSLKKYRMNSLLATFALKKYYNLIVKLVDQRFDAIEDNEYKIRVKKAAIYISMSRMESEYLERIKTYSDRLRYYQVDPSEALSRIKNWLLQKQDSLGHYDHAMVFTEFGLVKADGSSNIGMTYTSSICQIQWGFSSSIVQELGGFASVGTAAHELGHSLGAPHDGSPRAKSCPAHRNFLMTPATQTSPEKQKNFHMFSNCSTSFFKKMLKKSQASCLFDSEPPAERRDRWPGQMMDAEAQCRFVHGPRTALCGVMRLRKLMCARLWCKIPEDPIRCMSNIQVMAVYGTPCGDKKICIEGECKYHPEAELDTTCMFGDRMKSFCNKIVRHAPQHWCKLETMRFKCCQTCKPYPMYFRS